MTGAAGLLSRLADLGVTIDANEGALRLRPASALPPDLLTEIRDRKAELLVALALPAQEAATRTWPDPDTSERSLLDEMHAAATAGYLRAAQQRPPSWSDPAAMPSPGCWCSCCHGQQWWIEAHDGHGWRCATCHPSDHLSSGQVRLMAT